MKSTQQELGWTMSWPNKRFGISQSPPIPLINHHTYTPHPFPHKPPSCIPVSVYIKSSQSSPPPPPPPHTTQDPLLDSKNKIQSLEIYVLDLSQSLLLRGCCSFLLECHDFSCAQNLIFRTALEFILLDQDVVFPNMTL